MVEFHAADNYVSPVRPTVILLHGYGSGLGFFFRIIDPLLSSGQVGRVLLVDWLGMGGSDRPPCRRPIRGLSQCTTALCNSRFSPSQAVDSFLDPLHSLLKHMLPEKEPVWLVGHSLGGYLAARYALRSEDKIGLEKMILASPVGFPVRPNNMLPSAQLPTAFRLVDALWSANVTPQQLVRIMGATRGRAAVRRALAGRIPHLSLNEENVLDLLSDYLFHITVAHPSSEFAMNSLLEPGISPELAGVFAREPLEPLFAELASIVTSSNKDGNFPTKIKVLFGDSDWMRPNQPSAKQALEYMKPHLSAENVSVSIVPDAGHHLYIDNPDGFVQHILH